MAEETRGRSGAVVELVRLLVVVAGTGAGFQLGGLVGEEPAPLIGAVLGALVGYLLGGVGGRRLLRSVDETQERLRRVESAELIAGVVGGVLAVLLAGVLVFPLALLPGRGITIPIGLAVVVLAAYAGMRIGASRAGDLGRFVGVRGRLQVSAPSRGGGVKVVDTSALVDGRLLEIARAGFLDGTLVVPELVLRELQGLADSGDRRRRSSGRHGLDVVSALQQDGVVVVEVTDDDPVDVQDVDAKLARIARDRGGVLVTTDSGLSQVAEIAGIRVLDVNQLAEAVRPPAVPGQRLEVELLREGSEPEQAVGYLRDGTMVVVEQAADQVGTTQVVEITSINQSRRGRMLFGVLGVERRRSQDDVERRRSQDVERRRSQESGERRRSQDEGAEA